jgi:hypothetical protein
MVGVGTAAGAAHAARKDRRSMRNAVLGSGRRIKAMSK